MIQNRPRLHRFAIPFLLLLLYAGGLGIRRAVLEGQAPSYGEPAPFTMESALYFRRVQQVMDRGVFPAHDPDVEYPEGIENWKTDTLGSEYVYAALARLFPDDTPLTARLRWIEAAWFCLGIPLVVLWVGRLTGSRRGGWVAGLFYACSVAAIVRATGRELSHENFSLPLLILHLAFWVRARESGSTASFLFNGVVSACALAVALMTWDLIQFYLCLGACLALRALYRGAFDRINRESLAWFLPFAGLLLAGGFNPYLRAHAFLLSPAMLLAYGALAAACLSGRFRARRKGAILVLIAVAPLALFWLVPSGFQESYGHFPELLWAKLRHLNQKPWDPSALTFHQRIMWTPALHSATWPLTISLFPAIFPLTILTVAVWLYRVKDLATARTDQLIFFYSASLVAFFLFVRFQVFLALFAAALLGGLAAWSGRRTGAAKGMVLALLALGIVTEAAQALRAPGRWGRTNLYVQELSELTRWLEAHAAPKPVLANFGVSGSIAAYAGCPVILHPKFESVSIRRRVEEYGEKLFKGTEREFRDWADDHAAAYYVYSVGEFSDLEPRYQMRYFVDALNPPETAPARLFEERPETGNYFFYEWGNRKYSVFRILSRAEEFRAEELAAQAEMAFQEGALDRAEAGAIEAVKSHPRQPKALSLLQHIGALRDQGFGGGE